ncbi:MAG: histidine phosphatase family protein [Bacillota bacterium]
MEVYLVRHGETESNKEKRFQGWSESPLSPKGLHQAREAGFFLGRKEIDAVYASDLKRAIHTARIIGASCGLKPVESPLLREINFGQWEGLTYNEIEAQWGNLIREWFDDPFCRSAPGGETLEDVRQRLYSFIGELLKHEWSSGNQRLVLVSHGGAIRVLLYYALRLNREQFWNLRIENASVSLINLEKERVEVVYYNRVDHLESGLDKEELTDGL